MILQLELDVCKMCVNGTKSTKVIKPLRFIKDFFRNGPIECLLTSSVLSHIYLLLSAVVDCVFVIFLNSIKLESDNKKKKSGFYDVENHKGICARTYFDQYIMPVRKNHNYYFS